MLQVSFLDSIHIYMCSQNLPNERFSCINLTGLLIQAAALACLCLAETSCEFLLLLHHFLSSGQSLWLKVQFAAKRPAEVRQQLKQ